MYLYSCNLRFLINICNYKYFSGKGFLHYLTWGFLLYVTFILSHFISETNENLTFKTNVHT